MTATGVERLTDDDSLADAFAVRRAVFVAEQGVPEEREIDDHEDEATHLVARDDGTTVGTARLRALDESTAKVERVAVLPEFRGQGWGRRLLERTHDVARTRGYDRLVLHAQTDVEGFYRELGYRTTGDVFEEAGMPHVEMERRL